MAWFGMIIMMFDLLVVAPHFKRVSRIFSRSTAPIHGKGAFGQLSAASSGSGFKGLGVEGLRYSEPERLRKGGGSITARHALGFGLRAFALLRIGPMILREEEVVVP